MVAQLQTDYSNVAFQRGGEGRIRDNETFFQDAGRATPLAIYTVVAQIAATRKWVPLTVVDPTLTKGKLVCGAAGTAEAGFQAVADGEFTVSVDGVAMNITGLDFTGIEAPTATKGSMVCGAAGTDEAGFQAIADGEFTISIDGTAINVLGLDFSGIQAPTATNATLVCGAIGTNIAGFQAVTDGSFTIVVDGNTIVITTLDWSKITALDEIVDPINALAAGRFTAAYDSDVDVVTIYSNRTGAVSTMGYLTAGGGGTDVSGAGFLNGLTGTGALVQGTGDDGTDRNIADVINDVAQGRFFAEYDGAVVSFFSPRLGDTSIVSVLSAVPAGGGTDISGAGFLNGLTGVGTATAGTGDDGTDRNIADVINDVAAGRFYVTYDGAQIDFYSPTLGPFSSVSVLSAVPAGGGTDISGAGFLNGLTGVGTATAGTGGDGSDLPSGIILDTLTAAQLVAADVTGVPVLIGGNIICDTNQIVLENSLALTTVVAARAQTIQSVLEGRGIWLTDSFDISAPQP